MDTIASEISSNSSSDEGGIGAVEPCACMLARKCNAQGLPEDGGHVFDQEFDDEPGNSWCRCGMDVITYTCWLLAPRSYGPRLTRTIPP
jgi:hypothetical protein